jgi:hypothetical protein
MDAAKGAIHLASAPTHSSNREERGITKYANRIQGFAYGGAAALVVIIGLRSVYGRAIPSSVVIGGLLLEASLLLMIAAVYYFTPEEKGGGQPSTSHRILDGEKEILSFLRNKVLHGEDEILKLLRDDLLSTQKEVVSVLRNELLSGQKEIASAIRTETESRTEQQREVIASLEKESATRTAQQQELANTLARQDEHSTSRQQELLQTLRTTADATQQQLKSLTRIDEQITMLLKNEVDNIVKMKVQEIFTNLIRREADRRIEERLKV